MGRASPNQGKVFERYLEILHNAYDRDGRATIWKRGTEAVFTQRKWKPLKSKPDYEGLLYGSARHIDFDAKSTTKDTYSHPKDKMHQCEHLLRVHRAGGFAFLIIFQPHRERSWMILPEDHWELKKGWSLKLATQNALLIPQWNEVKGAYIPDWIALI